MKISKIENLLLKTFERDIERESEAISKKQKRIQKLRDEIEELVAEIDGHTAAKAALLFNRSEFIETLD